MFSARSAQWHSGRPRGLRLGIEPQPEPVGQARQVVEDADHVGDLEAAAVVEAELSQRPPVLLGHAGGRRGEFFRDLAECSFASRQRWRFAPSLDFDRLDQLGVAVLDTQKLCVRRCSVVAVLGCGRDGRHHLARSPRESAGLEHDPAEERAEEGCDALVGHDEPEHGGQEAEVVGPVGVGWQHGPHLRFARHRDPGVGRALGTHPDRVVRKSRTWRLNRSGVSKLKPWLPPGTFTSLAPGMWRARMSEFAGDTSRSASPVMTRVGTAISCRRSVVRCPITACTWPRIASRLKPYSSAPEKSSMSFGRSLSMKDWLKTRGSRCWKNWSGSSAWKSICISPVAVIRPPNWETENSRCRSTSLSGSGNVQASTRLRPRPGCLSASSWAIMPPIDTPTTWARVIPTASRRPAVSSAMSCMVYGPGGLELRPTPRLSKVIVR